MKFKKCVQNGSGEFNLNTQNFYRAYETLVNITVRGYEILLSQRR